MSDFIIKYFPGLVYLYLFVYDLVDLLDRSSGFIEIIDVSVHVRLIECFCGYEESFSCMTATIAHIKR